MRDIKSSFKNKVLLPTITIFILSVLIISANSYRLLDTAVRTKTNTNLEVFTDNILAQVNHLDTILSTSEQILNAKHVAIAKSVVYIIDNLQMDLSPEALQQFVEPLHVLEINIVNAEGILTHSNIPEPIGFHYGSTEMTKKYLALIYEGKTEIVERPRASVTEDGPLAGQLHYAGIPRANGQGFVQLGFDADMLYRLQEEVNIEVALKEATLGDSGYGMVLSGATIQAHPDEAQIGVNVSNEEWYQRIKEGTGFTWIQFGEESYYAGYKNMHGYTVVGLVPESEYNKERNQVLDSTILFFIIALLVMIAVVYFVMNRLLTPIKKVTVSLGEIAKGNFDARVEGDYNDEFALIKQAVNDMATSVTDHLNDKLQAERRAHELELMKLDLLVKVYYDALTSVCNRRYLDENLERLIRSLSRMNGLLSVLMIDIDYFKIYNDTYGHGEGDECLKKIAKALTNAVTREDDFVARYGGEEFVVVLPHTEEMGARLLANKMLQGVRALHIEHKGSEVADIVTISIGITTGHVTHSQTGEDYLKLADDALYMSKRNGRNQYSFIANKKRVSQS